METKATKTPEVTLRPILPEFRELEKMAAILGPAQNAFSGTDIRSLKTIKRRSQSMARSLKGKIDKLLAKCLSETKPDRAIHAQPVLGAWHNLKMIAINISNLCDDFQIKLVEKIDFSRLAEKQYRSLWSSIDQIFRRLAEETINAEGNHSMWISISCQRLLNLIDHYEAEHEERLLLGICPPRACSIFFNMLDSLRAIVRYLARLNTVINQNISGRNKV